jgi:diguanylate cyclase (GGDEF)-like protein
VLFFDLDRFKPVNDSFSHTVGDFVLIELAGRLTREFRASDLVARFGGDEFIVATVVQSAAEVTALAQRLMAEIRTPITAAGARVAITASVGIALSGQHGATDLDTLLGNADIALHHAKKLGRDRAIWFDPAQRDALTERLGLESELRAGVANGELHLDVQPAFDIQSGRAVSAEALVRWRHPRLGLLGPDHFIGIAEDTDIIHALGRWVIAHTAVCRQQFEQLPSDFIFFVNSSIHEVNRRGFANALLAILAETSLPAHQFGVEVTESAFSNETTSLNELDKLRDQGITIAIDDFGIGYSSLSRLWTFPIDIIKIDRTFIAQAEISEPMRAIISTIINLAHSLGAITIAEGVETPNQLTILTDLGCDQASGYLLARPAPIEQFGEADSPTPDATPQRASA